MISHSRLYQKYNDMISMKIFIHQCVEDFTQNTLPPEDGLMTCCRTIDIIWPALEAAL